MFRVLGVQDFEGVAVEDTDHGAGEFSEGGVREKRRTKLVSSSRVTMPRLGV
jgi:hypothetical protein